jgi:hypothetical protein
MATSPTANVLGGGTQDQPGVTFTWTPDSDYDGGKIYTDLDRKLRL